MLVLDIFIQPLFFSRFLAGRVSLHLIHTLINIINHAQNMLDRFGYRVRHQMMIQVDLAAFDNGFGRADNRARNTNNRRMRRHIPEQYRV